MKGRELTEELCKQLGYDGVEFACEYNGHRVYSLLVNSSADEEYGHPIFALITEDSARIATGLEFYQV